MSNTLFYMLLQYHPNFTERRQSDEMRYARTTSTNQRQHYITITVLPPEIFVLYTTLNPYCNGVHEYRTPKNAARFIMKMLNINHQQNNKLNGILKTRETYSVKRTYVCTFTSFCNARKQQAYNNFVSKAKWNEAKRFFPIHTFAVHCTLAFSL